MPEKLFSLADEDIKTTTTVKAVVNDDDAGSQDSGDGNDAEPE